MLHYHSAATGIATDETYGAQEEIDFCEQVGHLLRRAYQRHTAIFQRESCDEQLTPIQFVTLSKLAERGPSALSELVRLTGIDPATIRGVIKRLKGRDWVTLTSDPRDQRKVIVELTAAGRELLAAMTPHALKVSEETMGSLNPAERVALLHLLTKINA